MSRKSRMITSVAGVLAILLILVGTLQKGDYGMAHTSESDRTANDAAAGAQDRWSVIAGSVVRVADVDNVSCQRSTTAGSIRRRLPLP